MLTFENLNTPNVNAFVLVPGCSQVQGVIVYYTGELGYDGPLYDRFLHMTDNMLGPSPMYIKYLSYVYDRFCIWRTNFSGPNESVISKFTCIAGCTVPVFRCEWQTAGWSWGCWWLQRYPASEPRRRSSGSFRGWRRKSTTHSTGTTTIIHNENTWLISL